MNADRDHSEEPVRTQRGEVSFGMDDDEPMREVRFVPYVEEGDEPTPAVSVSGAAREATEAQVQAAYDGFLRSRAGCEGEQYGAARWKAVADAVVAAGPVDAEMAAVVAERERLRRGGAELGKLLKWQHDAVLDATGRHDLIGEDGDGDWAGVWEHLAELKPERDLRRLRDE